MTISQASQQTQGLPGPVHARVDRKSVDEILRAAGSPAGYSPQPGREHARTAPGEKAASLQTVAAMSALLEQVESADDLREACRKLVAGLQNMLGCSDAALGLTVNSSHAATVQAVATLAEFDTASDRIVAVQAVLNEAVIRDAVSTWPPPTGEAGCGLQAHARLVEVSQAAGVVSGPLKDSRGDVQGAWLFLLRQPASEDPRAVHVAELTSTRVAASLRLLKRAEGGKLARAGRSVSRAMRGRRKFLWLAGLVAGLLAAAVPLPETIRCSCEVQPVLVRYVAAPFEASLDQSLIRAGEVVSAGDVLARLDERELRMKLAGVEAEIQQAARKLDSQLADRKFAAARLTRLELSEAMQEQALHQHRLEQLEIRSPVDGVVLSGDLERAEGIRLSLGQTLFEIAPLHHMLVELEVSQADISRVRPGMPVEIDLEADDGRRRTGTVTRIHPQSARREQQYVFPAEVELKNGDGTLRPGMRGRARLTGERMRLGWQLVRRPWHQLRFMMGW